MLSSECSSSGDNPSPAESVTSGVSLDNPPINTCVRRARWLRLGVVLLFAAATLFAYFPILKGQFLWDDHTLVQGNRFIRSPLMLQEMFTHFLHLGTASSYYRPIQNVSFLIDYVIWGENPFGFHLSNLLFHAICGWLLYQLLRRILPTLLEATSTNTSYTERIALILACLWVVHPIHNAAVAYISGRADPLSFAFSAAAIFVALSSRQWAGTWKQLTGFALAWMLGLVALCSRESAACWMLLFALYVCFFERKCSRRTCGLTIAALLVLLGCWLLLRQIPPHASGESSQGLPTGVQRIVLIFRALGDYTRLLIAPVTLTMERRVWPEWQSASVTWFNFPLHFGWLGWLGAVALALATFGAFWRSKGQRLRIFGAAWFGLCFLPISNLFPLNAQVAEHWMYLASVGALLLVTGFAITLPERLLRSVSICVVVGFIPAMLLRTNLRASDWADPIRFYLKTLQTAEETPRIINNLAMTYRLKGDQARAEEVFRVGIKRFPSYAVLYGNLGRLLAYQGRKEEAAALFEKAQHLAKLQGNVVRTDWKANIMHGSIVLSERSPQETLAQLKSAREVTPEDWDLMQNYCNVLERVKGPDAVIPALEQFAWRCWWYKEPRLLLARKWLERKEYDKALFELHHAAQLDVWDAKPYSEIASIELDRKNLPEALKAQQIAVRRAPDNPKQRATLAYILHELGKEDEAVAELQEFVELERADKGKR